MSDQNTNNSVQNSSVQNNSQTNFNNLRTIIEKYVKLLHLKAKTQQMQILKKTNQYEFERVMGEFVPSFKEEYPFLFRMIISGADLEILNLFLNNMEAIDNGNKSFDEVKNDLAQVLHNKYVADKISPKKNKK